MAEDSLGPTTCRNDDGSQYNALHGGIQNNNTGLGNQISGTFNGDVYIRKHACISERVQLSY